MNAKIIAITNQKGGVGKTTTTVNLGIGLARQGKKVLLIDGDPQASLTVSLGNPRPDILPCTLATIMEKMLKDLPIQKEEAVIHHKEGIDLIPSSIELSAIEISLVNVMSRETLLKQYIKTKEKDYDFILIDCQPSLGMLTINSLAAASSVIIPVQTDYLPAKGLEQLLHTIARVKNQINPNLNIDGILMTMTDSRTRFSKEINSLLRKTYGKRIKVFHSEIPFSVRAKETSAKGKSIYEVNYQSKVATAYLSLTEEVLNSERKPRTKSDISR